MTRKYYHIKNGIVEIHPLELIILQTILNETKKGTVRNFKVILQTV